MKNNYILILALIILIVACDNTKSEKTSSLVDTNIVIQEKDTTNDDLMIKESHVVQDEEIYKIQELKIDDYTFKCGYETYNEEKFGFSNPGFIEVVKNGNIIFKDSFKGEGEVYVKSLGHHDLSGDKLAFTLNWGTEACDYNQHSRYYIITPKGDVNYLHECWSGSGGDGYASRYYEHIFPTDSSGIKNSLLIIEGLVFHEHDQSDLSDTTYISFNSDKFKINKPTNNMARAK